MTTGLAGAGVRVVLIGTGTHVEGSLLTDVPAVRNTLRDLGRTLMERCGLASENLRIIEDPTGPTDALFAVREAAEQADQALLVVYVGHGLLTRDTTLYLATTGSSTLDVGIADHQAIRYSALAAAVGESTARHTVVILDCCFSGRADPPPGRGFLLTSASGEELALAPDGARHTTFTGAVISFLRDGDAAAPPLLRLDDLYRYLWRAHAEQGRTPPRRRAGDLSGDVVLTENPAYVPVPPRAPGAPVPDVGAETCPYRGFRAYLAEDERYFRGRAALTATLVRRAAERLWAGHPLVVVGPSGAGKTSLLHAGLLAAVGRGELGVPRSGGWPRIALRPGSTPLATLTERIAELTGCPAGTVTEHPERIAGLLRKAPAAQDTRLVLVVDQFEQLFTQGVAEAERAAFVRLLAQLAGELDGEPAPALVVLGIRADFYGHCARFPELVGGLQDTLVVGPMAADELRAAITEPAELAGFAVSPELETLLLREIDADRPGGYEAGRLPLLSHALQATWGQQENRVLTADGYVRTGGIAGAVERTGETVYDAFTEPERDCVRQVLVAMVVISEDAPEAVRRVDVPELLAGLRDAEAGRRVLAALADARLVTVSENGAEITHEVLLRSWPRLREWIDADRDWLRARHRIRTDGRAWQDGGRDVSLLYRGAHLATTRATVAQSGRRRQLGAVEQEFLAASARHATRTQALRRGVVAMLAALTLIATGTAGIALTQRAAAIAQRATADQQRDLAVSRDLATRSEAMGNTDPTLAALLSVAAWRIAPTREARAALVSAVDRQAVTTFTPPGNGSVAFAFTSRGDGIVSARSHGMVSRWNTLTGAPLGRAKQLTPGVVALSPDGTTMAVDVGSSSPTGLGGGTLELWDLTTGKKIHEQADGTLSGITELVFSPDGTFLAGTGEGGGTVTVWTMPTGAVVARIPVDAGYSPRGNALAFGPNGTLAVATHPTVVPIATDVTVRVWNVLAPTQPPVPLANGNDTDVTSLAFTAKGDLLATANQNGLVQLWNSTNGQPVSTPFTDIGAAVGELAFSPDGTILATGSTDKTVRLWRVADRQPVSTPLTGQTSAIEDIAFSADGRTLAVSEEDGAVRVWQPFGRTPATTLTGHTDQVRAVVFTAHGLATGSTDHTVRLWPATPGTDPRRYEFAGAITALAVDHDGGMIAVGDHTGEIRLSPTDNLGIRSTLQVPGQVTSLALSRDGRTLAAANLCDSSDDTCLQPGPSLWDTATGRSLGELPAPDLAGTNFVTDLEFSPTQNMLVGTGIDSLTWWDTVTRQPTSTRGQFHSVMFSQDGSTLVAVRDSGTITIFDGNSRQQRRTITTNGQIDAVATNRDGTVLAIALRAGTIQLHDIANDQPAGAALSTEAQVTALAFDHTGHRLAAGLATGTVQLWDTSYAVDTVTAVCAKAGRPLTRTEWDQHIPAGPAYRPICHRS